MKMHWLQNSLMILTLTTACKCGSSQTNVGITQAPKPTGPAVVSIGDTVITVDEVKKKLEEQSPFMQARYRDLEHKKEFVQNLVRFEVLAQEAQRKGLANTPEVQDTIKKILVQELIRQSFDEKNATYTDDQLKAYYQQHIEEFVKPERVRAQHIFLAGAESDKAARAKAKAKAGELLSQLKANEAKVDLKHPQHASYSTTLFAELSTANSDDPATKSTGGDTRYMSKEDLTKQYSPAFADAVFALPEANAMTGIVETPTGIHIARLMARQQNVNRVLEDKDVKDNVKGRLFREEHTKIFEEFVEKLKKDANVQIDEKLLDGIEIKGATLPPGMPFGIPPAPPK